MYSSLLFLCPASGTEKSITDSFCPSWSIDYITCSVLCRMFHRSRHCFVILCVPSSPFSIHHMLLNMLINISSNIRSANIAKYAYAVVFLVSILVGSASAPVLILAFVPVSTLVDPMVWNPFSPTLSPFLPLLFYLFFLWTYCQHFPTFSLSSPFVPLLFQTLCLPFLQSPFSYLFSFQVLHPLYHFL